MKKIFSMLFLVAAMSTQGAYLHGDNVWYKIPINTSVGLLTLVVKNPHLLLGNGERADSMVKVQGKNGQPANTSLAVKFLRACCDKYNIRHYISLKKYEDEVYEQLLEKYVSITEHLWMISGSKKELIEIFNYIKDMEQCEKEMNSNQQN